jgi:outer membrane protein, heavy metal efflux system
MMMAIHFSALFFVLAISPPAPQPAPVALDPFDEAGLADVLWRQSPDLLAGREGLIEAESVRERSHVLPNPTLAATWGTIPLGEHNPPATGFADIPNYAIGISQLFELGKRGPRQRAADAAAKVASLGLLDSYRQSFFLLLDSLADQASACARRAVLERLVADSLESLRLQRARSERGDVAALEVDRLEVEHLRLRSAEREAEENQENTASVCSRILGADCPRFANEEAARRYLFQVRGELPGDDQALVSRRPDLQALQATEKRLQAEMVLAARAKIPDPTASLGYLHDQFVVAGNQANSLTLSLSLPLPVFDRGQVEGARAQRRLDAAAQARSVLSANALRAMTLGRQRLAILESRARLLDEDALPRAGSLAERMDAASHKGGASLIDVLLARRAFEELQLDRIDVATLAFKARLDLRRSAALFPLPAAPGMAYPSK